MFSLFIRSSFCAEHCRKAKMCSAPRREAHLCDSSGRQHGICDELKNAEKRNCASGPGAGHGFEKCIFNLHFHCIVLKIAENRNCASCPGGEHSFENVMCDPRSVEDSFFAFRSASAERNENHKNRPGALFGAAGRNARGRWGRYEGV